jgi:hypothetical protein
MCFSAAYVVTDITERTVTCCLRTEDLLLKVVVLVVNDGVVTVAYKGPLCTIR